MLRPGVPLPFPASWIGLLAAHFLTRLFGLTTLPIFIDEVVHIRGSVFVAEGERLFNQWNYGKGVSIWLNALLFPWAFDHYLWASRALVVVMGAVTLLATVAVAGRLFGERVALVAGVFYVLCPFVFTYDRLALTDPPMAMFATLALLASLRLCDRPGLGMALLLGVCLTLAVLTKATAILVVGIPVLAAVFRAPRSARAWAATLGALVLAGALCFIPLWIFFHVTSTVRLGLEYQELGLPARLQGNVPLAAGWLLEYLTAPVAILAVVGLTWGGREDARVRALLALLVVLPVMAFAAASTLWFPRYIVFVVPPALVLAAAGFSRVASALEARAGVVFMAACLLPAAHLDYTWATDPPRARIPEIDRIQYVYGWPSGYATAETVAFVKKELLANPGGLQVIAHSPSLRTTWRAMGLEFAYEPRVALKDLDLASAPGLRLLGVWGPARPTLIVVSPVGPARTLPDPAAWAHLGGLAFRACKPDGGFCDEVYRLCHGSSCPHLQPLLN